MILKEESPDCVAPRFGDFALCPHGLAISFAYWHYSICRFELQYAFLGFVFLMNKNGNCSQQPEDDYSEIR